METDGPGRAWLVGPNDGMEDLSTSEQTTVRAPAGHWSL